MAVTRRHLTPLLRWAGGKRWLVDHIAELVSGWVPVAYYEPFLGGAAVFLAFDWPRPRLSDVNSELIATYRAVAVDPEGVETGLRKLVVSREEYERQRQRAPECDTDRAVRLLYLNRCAYGGIYRTNRDDVFNVPYSGDRTLDSLWDGKRLVQLAGAFRGARIREADFESALSRVPRGAFVYCDPAYTRPGSREVFSRYSANGFTWADQERLAHRLSKVAERGAVVAVTNAAVPEVARLYPDAQVATFPRRHSFPKANGGHHAEALYVIGRQNMGRGAT